MECSKMPPGPQFDEEEGWDGEEIHGEDGP